MRAHFLDDLLRDFRHPRLVVNDFLGDRRRRKQDAEWYAANAEAVRATRERPDRRLPVELPEGARIPGPEPASPPPVGPFVLHYHQSKWDNPYVVAQVACHSICAQTHEPGDDVDSPCLAVFLRSGSRRASNWRTRPDHSWSNGEQPEWFTSAFGVTNASEGQVTP